MNRQELGKQGEEVAAHYLRQRGYQILVCNYRCRYGEIDLVTCCDGVLVFVEVKTRSNQAYGQPFEAVTWRKQQKIKQCALHYLQTQQPQAKGFRFDVISLLYDGRDFSIQQITDAIQG